MCFGFELIIHDDDSRPFILLVSKINTFAGFLIPLVFFIFAVYVCRERGHERCAALRGL